MGTSLKHGTETPRSEGNTNSQGTLNLTPTVKYRPGEMDRVSSGSFSQTVSFSTWLPSRQCDLPETSVLYTPRDEIQGPPGRTGLGPSLRRGSGEDRSCVSRSTTFLLTSQLDPSLVWTLGMRKEYSHVYSGPVLVYPLQGGNGRDPGGVEGPHPAFDVTSPTSTTLGTRPPPVRHWRK